MTVTQHFKAQWLLYVPHALTSKMSSLFPRVYLFRMSLAIM
jgi:hypothetical protein